MEIVTEPTAVIDTTITYDGRRYHRFTKDEQFKDVTLESSPKLMGPWTLVPNFSLATLRGYEGPECVTWSSPRPRQARHLASGLSRHGIRQ